MKNTYKTWLIFFLLFSIPFIVGLPSQAATRDIRVGILSGQASFSIGSKGAITVIDKGGKSYQFGRNINAVQSGPGNLLINGKPLSLPVKLFSKSHMVINKHPYRGYFQIINSGKGLSLVNILPVEDYLRGVLKMEVNPSWPSEMLKSQAIISRTYALKHIGRHASQGFDVCNSSHCQVYRGINAEDPVLDKAIKATHGIVVMYGKTFALTPFHSDSGGATADVSTVWGGKIPYLKGAKEPVPYTSPYSGWKVDLTADQIQRGLQKNGHNVGEVRSVEIMGKDPFGRINTVKISGSKGDLILKSNLFRIAVGADHLKSTFFNMTSGKANETAKGSSDIRIDRTTLPAPMLSFVDPEDPELNPDEEKLLTVLTQQGYFSSEEIISMLLDPSVKKSFLIKAIERGNKTGSPKGSKGTSSKTSTSSPSKAGVFSFTGKGWGHGVGLSQWGARALAEKGWTTGNILEHYFPGTSLKKIY